MTNNEAGSSYSPNLGFHVFSCSVEQNEFYTHKNKFLTFLHKEKNKILYNSITKNLGKKNQIMKSLKIKTPKHENTKKSAQKEKCVIIGLKGV